ncbi:MAG: uncharacterized protein JWN03_7870 [Nocardia sp.]|uniref:YcnI family copper-binding membrane protein n=1 Tax=Nocardia sp. TaxID=1821 RepID=UPI00261729E4|nr:YcnI family protein [Nocardia sp.]MCU1647595.1 uncharacterized protein [Nocardia sp.]
MRYVRWTVIAAAAGMLVLAGSGVASAHVEVSAPDAAPGGMAVLTVRVPTESATAGTVKVELTLPKDNPLAVVRSEQVPGWQVEQHRATLATPVDNGHGGKVSDYVASVTFTARDGASIGPGEFGEFKLLVGPLPHVSELVFPAIQTYSDGTVVSWIERSADGTTPDKPAPTLRLAAAHDHGDPAAVSEQSVPQHDSGAAGRISVTALVASGLAVALAAAPRLRWPRRG